MTIFEVEVTREATYLETFLVELEAFDQEEAEDFALKMISDFPDTDFKVKRCQKIKSKLDKDTVSIIEVETKKEETPKIA